MSLRKKWCLFMIRPWCPWWCLQGVNLGVLTAHVIRLAIVPCSKQLGCELLLAGLYSSIRRCERMTSDTSGSAVAVLQSHNLQHKSCVWVCWATKYHSKLISLTLWPWSKTPSCLFADSIILFSFNRDKVKRNLFPLCCDKIYHLEQHVLAFV